MSKFLKIGLLTLALVLSACGGGGSNTDIATVATTPTANNPAPVASQPSNLSADKDMTAFVFTRQANGNLTTDAVGVISGNTITVNLPLGVNAASLVANFLTTGASVSVDGFVQSSGNTWNNFLQPVVYTVTAQDGSTKNYNVTLTNQAIQGKDITVFMLAGANGSIVGNSISVTVPYAANTASLVAAFATTGVAVKVGSAMQTSGSSANNFSKPVVYSVFAQDGSSKDYTVTVTKAANNANGITSFSIAGASGSILGNSISVTLPANMGYSKLVASFTTTGVAVKVGNVAQQSGVTANDFLTPLVYTVQAADGSSQNYVVTIGYAVSAAKEMTAYSIGGVSGKIVGNAISVTLPGVADRTKLVAVFSTTSASVNVNGTPQISGSTTNNFNSPVTYSVIAQDGTVSHYVVTVTGETVSFKGNWDVGLTGAGNWNWIETMAPDRLQRVTSPVHRGNYAVRVEVRPGDDPVGLTGERAEVSVMTDANGKPMNENEFSGTQYYSFSVKLDSNWQSPARVIDGQWASIFQLHGPANVLGSPPVMISVQDRFSVYLGGGDRDFPSKSIDKYYPLSNNSLNLGQWVDLIIKVKFAKDFTGAVAVWRRDEGQPNYEQVLAVDNVPTLVYRSSLGPTVSDHYWKYGLYRAKQTTITNVLWLDSLTRYSYNY